MNPELRRELNAVLPYDAPPAAGAPPDMSSFAINNLVLTIHYSNGAGEMPLPNPRRLAGGPLGSVLRLSDRGANYHTKVRCGATTIALIMHPNQCIICGVRSYLVLLVVCNVVTKHLRKKLPSCATFHFHTFIDEMQNSVCRVAIDAPLNFDRLQALVRPEFRVARQQGDASDAPLAALGARRGARRERSSLKINHHELSFLIPQSASQRKAVEVVVKFYASSARSIVCINGVHSIYLAHQLLRDIVAFLGAHRDALRVGHGAAAAAETTLLERRAISRSLVAQLHKEIKKKRYFIHSASAAAGGSALALALSWAAHLARNPSTTRQPSRVFMLRTHWYTLSSRLAVSDRSRCLPWVPR